MDVTAIGIELLLIKFCKKLNILLFLGQSSTFKFPPQVAGRDRLAEPHPRRPGHRRLSTALRQGAELRARLRREEAPMDDRRDEHGLDIQGGLLTSAVSIGIWKTVVCCTT